jgi:Zn-dependent protease
MYQGAFRIATISGVPVRVHWTFLILLAWVFGNALFRHGSLAEGLVALVFIASVLICVVAHEFGHVLAARWFGVRTRGVMLLPIGGVASLERMPEKPWQELVVAIAGPLVNVVIALALLPGLVWNIGLDTLASLGQPGNFGRDFVASIAGINVWLMLFNLIPAFPMDGGRILRAVLAMFTNRVTATRAAAFVGQILAVGMALVGVLEGLPMLMVLALFIFTGAGAEAAGAQEHEALRSLPVAAVMQRSFRVLGASDPLQAAADELLANSQPDYPITRDGTPSSPVVGLLTRADLVRALADFGPASPVSAAMRPAGPSVRASDPARQAWQALRAGDRPFIPVVENGVLIGLLTPENVPEAILVRAALDHRPDAPRRMP